MLIVDNYPMPGVEDPEPGTIPPLLGGPMEL
jgi:hypothetical protein